MSVEANKFVKFHDGTKMPSVGLGTLFGTPSEMEVTLTVAVEEAGYRHIDTAFLYENEAAIGATLKRLTDTGKVKRQDLFIVTKLPGNAMRPSDVERHLRKSLENLQMDYVDLYLVHMPIGVIDRGYENHFPVDDKGRALLDLTTDHVAIWKKMEEMVDKGLTKAIGLSNFNIRQIQRVLDNARIKPANLQVECHAYFQQTELFDFCIRNGITFTAYAPLGSPGMVPFVERFTGKKITIPSLLDDPELKKIAERHKKTVPQVLLRWIVDRGMVVIPKSSNPKRIRENIDIFDFKLSEDDGKTIDGLNRDFRMFKLDFRKGLIDHPEYPF